MLLAKNWLGITLIGVGFLVLAGAGCSAKPEPLVFATVKVFAGSATIDGQPITSGGTVEQGKTIKTDATGRIEVLLPDGSITRLGENGELTIQETGKKTVLGLNAGNLFTRVSKVSGRESFTVNAKTTVATVRGTVFAHFVGAPYKILGIEDTVEVGFYDGEEKLVLSPSREWMGLVYPPVDQAAVLTDSERVWLKWNIDEDKNDGNTYDQAIYDLVELETTIQIDTKSNMTINDQPVSTTTQPSNQTAGTGGR